MSSAERRGQRLRAAMEVLARSADGLAPREVWHEVCRVVPLDSDDHEVGASGAQRAETDFRWHTADLVHAGWLRKDVDVWTSTEDGRWALSAHPEPEKFARVARETRPDDELSASATDSDSDSDTVIPDPAARPVLDAAALIVRHGLDDGGSAFAPGRSVWSAANARELGSRFDERPDEPRAELLAKLHRRLDGCSDDALLLAAEMLTLCMLPLHGRLTTDTKRSRVTAMLGWMAAPVQTPPLVAEAFEHGVFPASVWFHNNVLQWLGFLSQFVIHWRGRTPDQRREAFADPWSWKQLVVAAPGPKVPSLRHALLYLVHPATFLPILSEADKRAISTAFAAQLPGPTGDVDRDLLQVTLALQADRRGPVGYYESPYLERWRSEVDVWPELAVDVAGGSGHHLSGHHPSGHYLSGHHVSGHHVSGHHLSGHHLSRRAWLVRGSSVRGHNLVPAWLGEGFVSLAASSLRPVDASLDEARLKEIVDVDYGHQSYAARSEKAHEFHAFLTRMRPGDLVVTTAGGSLYLGVVAGPAGFVESTDRLSNLRRRVDWREGAAAADDAELPAPLRAKLSSQAEVVDLTEELALLDLLVREESGTPATEGLVLPDADDALADDLLVGRAWLQEVIELLRDRRQLILYGPPGTGKTYLAQHLAGHLTVPNAVKLVQFHPSYSYEDFFEGIRPAAGEHGTLRFERKPGPFRRFVEAARQDPSTPYILVIDEINRADLAKVFGELYFLLEYREQSVGLLYSGGEEDDFTLPANVFFIGTMNSADRSIALVDAAMRRRFAFVALRPADEPVRGLLGRWLVRHGLPDEAAALLAALNSRVPDTDFAVGPSYLMRPEIYAAGGLERVWRTSILPLLEELHHGDGTEVAGRYGLTALRGTVARAEADVPK